MKSVAYVLPILPGKADAWRRVAGEALGPRLRQHEDSRLPNGASREMAWIQPTPDGEVLTMFLEGDDPVGAQRKLMESKGPHDVWFKKQVQDVTGVDLNRPLAFPLRGPHYEAGTPMLTDTVRALALAFPLRPGATDEWLRFVDEIKGPRRLERQEALRRFGVTRETWFLQPAPEGDIAIVYLESEDPARAFENFRVSDHPFDRWFKARAGALHGLDFSQPLGPIPEMTMDWEASLMPH